MSKYDSLVSVSCLAKTYGNGARGIPVLRDINLEVYEGEMVAIKGPSGCGKSTLLYILGLFLSPSRGTYCFTGEDVLALDRDAQAEFRNKQVGFVFQSSDLLEKSTVYDNLEFPLIYAGVKRRMRPDMITEALEMVKLSDRIKYPSNVLSGGEMQRVAIARALVNKPRIILADEPTGQLDAENTRIIMEHFSRVVADSDTAVLMVTHDSSVADRCNRVYELTNGVLKSERG